MTKDIKFYDTCSLLLAGESLFEQDDKFLISSMTLAELEHIKTSANKDPEVKYQARVLLHLLDKYPDKYEVIIHTQKNEYAIEAKKLALTPDTMILSDAIYANDWYAPDSVIFVTNDLALKTIANIFFGDGMIESVEEEPDDYVGYKEVQGNDELLSEFYSDETVNHFNLQVGEYLLIKNSEGDTVDLRVWTGEKHRYLKYSDFNSQWFGKITPYHNDPYQKFLFDSLCNNRITMIKGPAGSGKSYVALGFLMSMLEKQRIDKIIVFCNTVATMNSAKLGFYPGSRLEKLLDSQIGNFLISKFGGIDGVNRLINSGQLELLPLSDIRGYDTTGMRAGVYITEAQNLDRVLMKLALQRIGEDCICIIDGDNKQQVDLKVYDGANNGMRAMSRAFRGEDIYGEIELKNVYRSRIAQIAEKII